VTISYGKEGYWQVKADHAADLESLQEGRQRARLEALATIKELKQQLKQQLDASALQQQREQQLLQGLQRLQQVVKSAIDVLAGGGVQLQQVQGVCRQLAAAGEAAKALLDGARPALRQLGCAASEQPVSIVAATSVAAR
jgi:hypothetical protein